MPNFISIIPVFGHNFGFYGLAMKTGGFCKSLKLCLNMLRYVTCALGITGNPYILRMYIYLPMTKNCSKTLLNLVSRIPLTHHFEMVQRYARLAPEHLAEYAGNSKVAKSVATINNNAMEIY